MEACSVSLEVCRPLNGRVFATTPAVIQPANRSAGSIVPALRLVEWLFLHLEHTACGYKIILKYAHNNTIYNLIKMIKILSIY